MGDTLNHAGILPAPMIVTPQNLGALELRSSVRIVVEGDCSSVAHLLASFLHGRFNIAVQPASQTVTFPSVPPMVQSLSAFICIDQYLCKNHQVSMQALPSFI